MFYSKFFLIGLFLALLLLWPLFIAPYFTHHDDVQIIRLFEMDKCIKDQQIPCRWIPDLGNLYGYPLFNYYAPLPYYYGELSYLLTGNLILAAKIMFATAFIGSFVFMYFFSRKFFGELGGSLAAIFYAFAPYHALDFYVRGAMGEMWGLMFFPAILWGLTRLEERINIINFLVMGLAVAGLISAHNLSALIFTPLSLVFAGMLFMKRRNAKFIWSYILSFVFGCLLSAFYLIPMVVEKDLVHVDTTVVGYFSYTEHFKGFRRLFLDRSWGWGPSVREVPGGEKDGLSYQIGWVHVLAWMLAMFLVYKFGRKNKYVSSIVIFASIATASAIFMVNPRSQFVWDLIEPLKFLQFPWRFLLIVIFLISFISGSIFIFLQRKKNIIWIILVTAVVLFNFSYFLPEKFLYVTDEKLLQGKDWERQVKRSIYDYLPTSAKEPPDELAKERYQILTGEIEIKDFKKGTNWISFKADTKTHSIVRLSQYYFPNWKIWVDGKEIIVDYQNNSLGLMTFILGKGNHTIEARLYDTPIRSIANLISLIALVLTLFLFISQLGSVKRWIQYYRKRIH